MGKTGRGGKRGGKGGKRGGGRSAGGGSTSTAAGAPSTSPTGEGLMLQVVAGPAFYARLPESNCPVEVLPFEDGSSSNTRSLKMGEWGDLDSVLAWFRDLIDFEPTAELIFSPTLIKAHRAQVHRSAEATGLGALEAVSSGIGDQRTVKTVRKGAAKKVQLDEDDEERAFWLRKWALEEGHTLSRDEAKEMIATGDLPPSLRSLWTDRLGRQHIMAKLCGAAATGNTSALQEALSDPHAKDLLFQGAFNETTGDSPLHLAASRGHIEVIHTLLAAGANVNAVDGRGMTAVWAARRGDQSDAEGILLRNGAVDEEGRAWPGEAALPAGLGQGNGAGSEGVEADEEHQERDQQAGERFDAGGQGPHHLHEEVGVHDEADIGQPVVVEQEEESEDSTEDTLTGIGLGGSVLDNGTAPATPGMTSAPAPPIQNQEPAGKAVLKQGETENGMMVHGMEKDGSEGHLDGMESTISVCGTEGGANAADVTSTVGDYSDAEYSLKQWVGTNNPPHSGSQNLRGGGSGSIHTVEESENDEEERKKGGEKEVNSPAPPVIGGGVSDEKKSLKKKKTVSTTNQTTAAPPDVEGKQVADQDKGKGAVVGGMNGGVKGVKQADIVGEINLVQEWSDWASKHSASLLAGVGVVTAAAAGALMLWKIKAGSGRRTWM